MILHPIGDPSSNRDKKVMKQTVVLYPVSGVGHIVPMAELGKVFLNHGYDVTLVLVPPPFKSANFGADVVERIAASNPSITFHYLPPVPPGDFASSGKHPFVIWLQMLYRYGQKLENFLCSIPRQHLHSLVVDMFGVDAIQVAKKLVVPVYTFVTSGASALAVFAQIPALLSNRQAALKELGDTPLNFLGVPPMPASHLVKEVLEHPEDERCKAMTNIFKGAMESKGILVNTFELFESRAVQALRDPLCNPDRQLPPVYCVGPLVGTDAHQSAENKRRHECLAWLDAQPKSSVVFLCFGSMGALSAEQLKEIAFGLDKSGQRFLWVVRTPIDMDDPKKFLEQLPEPDLNALLPDMFLERTKDQGLVVKSWAPQVEVLHHPAIGAFVTHCGWNSTLEAIVSGIPMLCWPLDMEQKMNKVFMIKDIGVGVEMEGYTTGLIKAVEVEAKVRLVMGSEEGRDIESRSASNEWELPFSVFFISFLLSVCCIVNVCLLAMYSV